MAVAHVLCAIALGVHVAYGLHNPSSASQDHCPQLVSAFLKERGSIPTSRNPGESGLLSLRA